MTHGNGCLFAETDEGAQAMFSTPWTCFAVLWQVFKSEPRILDKKSCSDA